LNKRRLAAATVACATALAGCATIASQHAASHLQATTSSDGAPTGAPPPSSGQAANGLAYSTASPNRAQAMPAPGTCHYRGEGLWAEPDPHCTPGALNPAVTQADLDQTICRPGGYTESIRPPEHVAEPEKRAAMAAYSNTGDLGAMEFDHLHSVPLRLGGAANDCRNMWPEANYPAVSPDSYYQNPKDILEDRLAELVCRRTMSLAKAQAAIASNWVAAYRRYVR